MKSIVPWFFALLLCSTAASAEEAMSVQAALDYQLPENTCSKPEFFVNGTDSGLPIQDSGRGDNHGYRDANLSDVDGDELEREARKEERWKKCLAEYKEGLLNDMERLKGSAQHGLTEAQAHAIVAHMVLIQDVYLSPDGLREPTAVAGGSGTR